MSLLLNRRPADQETIRQTATAVSSTSRMNKALATSMDSMGSQESKRSLLSSASSVKTTAFSKLLKKMKRQEKESKRKNGAVCCTAAPVSPVYFAQSQRKAVQVQRQKERDARSKLGKYRMSLDSLRACNLSTKRRAQLRHGRPLQADVTSMNSNSRSSHQLDLNRFTSLGSRKRNPVSTVADDKLQNVSSGKTTSAVSTVSRSPEPQRIRARSRFSMANRRHALSVVTSPAFHGSGLHKQSSSHGNVTSDTEEHHNESDIDTETDTDNTEVDTESDIGSNSGIESDNDCDEGSERQRNEFEVDSDDENEDRALETTGEVQQKVKQRFVNDETVVASKRADSTLFQPLSTSSFTSPGVFILRGSTENHSHSVRANQLLTAALKAEEDGRTAEADELFCLSMSYTSRSKLCTAQLGLVDFYLRTGRTDQRQATEHNGQSTDDVHLYLDSARAMLGLAKLNAKSDYEIAETQARQAALDVLEGGVTAPQTEASDDRATNDASVETSRRNSPLLKYLSIRALPAEEMHRISRISDVTMPTHSSFSSLGAKILLEPMPELPENRGHAIKANQLRAAALEAEEDGRTVEAEDLLCLAMSYSSRSQLCTAQLDLSDFFVRAGMKILIQPNGQATSDEVKLLGKYHRSARAMAGLAKVNARSDHEVLEVQERIFAFETFA